MCRFLRLLQKHFLIKFSYSTRSINCFPTPLQLQYLLRRQKHQQNLKLYSHMVPWLEKFLEKRELSQGAIFRSFTKLDIGSSPDLMTITPTKMCWPLKNPDLYILQILSLDGRFISPKIFPTLIDQFAGRFFISLITLSLGNSTFGRTLALANVPPFNPSAMKYCWGSNRFLSLPDNFRLRSLSFQTYGEVKTVIPLLAQIKGLQ